jgi:hypothetical protein
MQEQCRALARTASPDKLKESPHVITIFFCVITNVGFPPMPRNSGFPIGQIYATPPSNPS